ncbi:MAG: hypothetical protein WDO13_21715 [Verrucomicrobiota bacterium]
MWNNRFFLKMTLLSWRLLLFVAFPALLAGCASSGDDTTSTDSSDSAPAAQPTHEQHDDSNGWGTGFGMGGH